MTNEKYTGFDPKYFVSDSSDYVDQLFDKDRRDLLDRIDWLKDLMEQRMKIMYSNFDRIDYDSCALGSKVEQLKQTQPYESQQMNNLERSIFELERQKRNEKECAWKDVWLLNKELLELMKQYQRIKGTDEARRTS